MILYCVEHVDSNRFPCSSRRITRQMKVCKKNCGVKCEECDDVQQSIFCLRCIHIHKNSHMFIYISIYKKLKKVNSHQFLESSKAVRKISTSGTSFSMRYKYITAISCIVYCTTLYYIGFVYIYIHTCMY